MNDDVDFEQFIKLLDAALASDDKNVKNALRKFLFVAALALGDDVEPGPFTKMMDTIDALQRRIATLEASNTNKTYTDNTGSPVWINSPQYPTHYYGGNTPTTTTGTWNITPYSTSVTLGGTSTTNTATYSINAGSEEDTGTKVKDQITDQLKKLVKAT